MKEYADFLKRVIPYSRRKIIIWGAGIGGIQIQKALAILGISVKYFVDSRQDENIFSPDKLIEEDKTDTLVVVSPRHIPYIIQIDEQLENWGWEKEVNYINYVSDTNILAHKQETYFDPFLGYSQIRDMEGFQIYGSKESENRIVVLGNCTSVSNRAVTMWVDYLAASVNEKNSTLYNGACAGYSSSQELLKLIRDVLLLHPRMIIVFNGVIDATNANRQPDYPYYTKFEYNLLEQCFTERDESKKYKGMQNIPRQILYGARSDEKNYEHYVRNMRIMNAIAKALNIEFFCFLQPSLYCNSFGLFESEKQIYDAFYSDRQAETTYTMACDFYEKVTCLLKDELWFYDMTEVFRSITESSYLDEIHYTDKGHQVIADYIIRILRERIRNNGTDYEKKRK